MGKHINFLGYSLWIRDEEQVSDGALDSKQTLYSPSVIAAYCLFTNFAVGTLLYSINVLRRGYSWQGRLIATLSILFLAIEVLVTIAIEGSVASARIFLNMLVAICLYSIEKPHFNRAIRNGARQARWWLPLVWVLVGVFILSLLYAYMCRATPPF